MTDRLTLRVGIDGPTGGVQVSLSQLDEHGAGHGYRLAGPKFTGSGEVLVSRDLDERDAEEIRRYLDAVFPVPVPESGDFAARCFEIEDGSSVSLACPDCGDPMLLTSDEVPTLGDVILVAAAHLCEEWDSQDSAAAVAEEETHA